MCAGGLAPEPALDRAAVLPSSRGSLGMVAADHRVHPGRDVPAGLRHRSALSWVLSEHQVVTTVVLPLSSPDQVPLASELHSEELLNLEGDIILRQPGRLGHIPPLSSQPEPSAPGLWTFRWGTPW